MSSSAEADDGLWIPIGKLAERAGIKQPVMSRRINRLVQDGLLQTRPGRQGAKLVNVAQYDRVRAKTGDGVRILAASTSRASECGQDLADAPPDEATAKVLPFADRVLTQEQTKRVAYQAELARLDFEERQGKLISVDVVTESMAKLGEALVRSLDGYSTRADELAVAVGKDGVQGARMVTRAHTREVRRVFAAELRRMIEEGVANATTVQPESSQNE